VSALRLVYFGTPAFALPTLERLVEGRWPIVAVVTQPDRPRGRGQRPSAGPVKAFAESRSLRVLQPERLKEEAFLEEMRRLAPDVGVVAAYGKILPQALLDVPRLGLVNVHASLLPRWRGASPVHRAVMAGDCETGVSIMRVVRELDAGPVFAVARRPIGPDETTEEVERDLAVMGGALLGSVLRDIEAGRAVETPQESGGASYAPRLTKEEGVIAWEAPAQAIHNQVRGLQPWPHAYSFFDAARVIVLKSALPSSAGDAVRALPGEVVALEADRVTVAAGDGHVLELLRLQLEGRRPVSGREFAAGVRLKVGRRFGVWPR
jgi:methionyl-tRNA formyltransferase